MAETQASIPLATSPESRAEFEASLLDLPKRIAEVVEELNQIKQRLEDMGYEVTETW